MYEVLIGFAIAFVAQVAKKLNIDQKYVVTALAIVSAIVYYFYQQYVDIEQQKNIVQVITEISGSATILYNFIKIALENKEENG